MICANRWINVNMEDYEMKKVSRKIYSLIATCILITCSSTSYAYNENTVSIVSRDVADSEVDNYKQSLNSLVTEYALKGSTIIEKSSLIDVDGEKATLYRTINVDGSGKLVTKKGNDSFCYTLSNQNYNQFLSLVKNKNANSKIDSQSLKTKKSNTGKDITGSQYKHVLLGKITRTVDNSTVTQIKSNGVALALSIVVGLLNPPMGIASGIASYIYSSIMALGPYKIKITQSSYEVRFSYDDGYYTHCYHEKIKSYNSSNKVIKNETCYYQVIGG